MLLNQVVWRKFQGQWIYFWNKRDSKGKVVTGSQIKSRTLIGCAGFSIFPQHGSQIITYNTYLHKALVAQESHVNMRRTFIVDKTWESWLK